MAKASVKDLGDITGKVVLVRQDLNVPLDGTTITDDTRIREAIPTLKFLVGKGAKVLVATHLVSLLRDKTVLGFMLHMDPHSMSSLELYSISYNLFRNH